MDEFSDDSVRRVNLCPSLCIDPTKRRALQLALNVVVKTGFPSLPRHRTSVTQKLHLASKAHRHSQHYIHATGADLRDAIGRLPGNPWAAPSIPRPFLPKYLSSLFVWAGRFATCIYKGKAVIHAQTASKPLGSG